ncbi:transmembrane 9 superfamily member 2-like [Bradysia coprophila]|uniref:transmembrane 9 superfamily member 2-like n=1 Tax=Bradysia coprophila TaxID=38358 RepID=UPI00187D6F0D|nr:transmembrane 9 superfamily member 2-like [Bradysia coprophila]
MRLSYLWIFNLFSGCFNLNLPGLGLVDYCISESEFSVPCKSYVDLYVNRLNSEKTLIPYEYHHFDFCPTDESDSPIENLGQIVFGDRIRPGPYAIDFLKNETCKQACTRRYLGGDLESEKRLTPLMQGISLNYQHNWIVDNLPVAFCYEFYALRRPYCSYTGFPMGYHPESSDDSYPMSARYMKSGFYYPFNHVDLIITYQSGTSEEWDTEFGANLGRIISVKVRPRSINHRDPYNLDCNVNAELLAIPTEPLEQGRKLNITYTYSVTFVRDNSDKWSSRWDYIVDSLPYTKIQWYNILCSLVVVLFLSGMVASIMLRTMHKDIERYNRLDVQQEIFGWVSLHGDVFRPPRYGMLLAVLLGSGIQVFGMALVTFVFAGLGLLSPANRGSLMSCLILSFGFLGTPAGYISARIYKSFGGDQCMISVLLTSTLCPGIVFSLTLAMNAILWIKTSSGAIPISTLFSLLGLWLCGSVPLTLLGAFFGFGKSVLELPVQTNEIPRQIPNKSICMHPISGIVMGGILPFICIYIQLYFALNSIWASQMYDIFGFQFSIFLILVITCSESTILLCYSHLRAEDYRWWWRSFLSSGFTAVYLFGYCCHYFVTKLDVQDVASTILYFGYTLIVVFLFFLMTGTIGFLACLWFIRKVYSHIEVGEKQKISAIYKS